MKKKSLLLLLGLIVGILILGVVTATDPTQTAAKIISPTKKEVANDEMEIYANGRIQMAEVLDQYSAMEGSIAKLNVKQGDSVKKGQQLLVLDTTELNRQISEVRKNIADLNIELKKIKKTDTNLEQNVEQKALSINQAKLQVEYKESQRDKVAKGVEGGWETKEKLENAEYDLRVAQIELKNAEEDLANEKKRLDNEKKRRDDEKNRQELEKQSLLIKIQRETERLRNLQADIQRSVVKASGDGMVVELKAQEGMFVDKSMVLLTIGSPKKIEIIGEINEFDISKIKIGNPVTVEGDALAEKLEGVISYISPFARQNESKQGTYVTIKVKVSKPEVDLKPGLNVTLTAYPEIRQEKKYVYLIPDTAVIEKDDRNYVYILQNDLLELKEIQTNAKLAKDSDNEGKILGGDNFSISVRKPGQEKKVLQIEVSGLSGNEKIIANPTPDMKPGDRIDRSKINKEGTKS